MTSAITDFASSGIYIEILADGFKIEGCSICWRPYVHWKEEKWEEADLGCYPDYQKAFDVAVDFAKYIKDERNTIYYTTTKG